MFQSVSEYSTDADGNCTQAENDQGTDTETDRATERQLVQHLQAFLMQPRLLTHYQRSPEEIKRAHAWGFHAGSAHS